MAKKATTTTPEREPMAKVSTALLQRRVATLEKALASVSNELAAARGDREESEAEEALEKLRDLVRLALPTLRKGMGPESADDSLARYEAYRAIDDLTDEV